MRQNGLLALFAAVWMAHFAASAEVRVQNAALTAVCDPATLDLMLTPGGRDALRFDGGGTRSQTVTDLVRQTDHVSWRLPERGLTVALRLTNASLHVEFTAERSGKLDWPAFKSGAVARGWIFPLFEGAYVPVEDETWQAHLAKESPMNTTSGFILPFWGVDCGEFTLTCLMLNPFNNELTFDTVGGRLRLRCAHEFTANNPVKRSGFVLTVGASSPIEPARQYRRWLESRGEFARLADKIKHAPEAAKLLGAAHAYLWGDALLGMDDVKDWKGFARMLLEQSQAANTSPGKQLWSALDRNAQKAVGEIAKTEWADRYSKNLVAEGLNRALSQTNGCAVQTFAKAFGGFLKPVETWGEGVSPQMIHELADAGLDRLWLGAGGWEGFVKRPETVTLARAKGFLIGPYDSYHSIHSPNLKPDDTWPTAQFDEELYRTGAIIGADGRPRPGFKQRGYLLSPKAARPWVERRVASLMKTFPANSWFVDCDGFGEFFDDYSPAHPATQASDLAERLARCAWIRDTYGAVIGSEGCSAGIAGTLHFAHGVLTPVIGWGDPDLTDKQSKFYLGAYYPPNAPAVFFKPVPLKPRYRHFFYDPRFRLPLFQTVFHDSVVTTHHWSNPSLKFPEVAGTVELLELLYGVPPLYHLDRPEFAKRKNAIKRHFEFFSPLHRELATLPLTDFRWLSGDKLVHQTVFGDRVEITANFSGQAFPLADATLAPATVSVARRDRPQQRLTYSAPANAPAD